MKNFLPSLSNLVLIFLIASSFSAKATVNETAASGDTIAKINFSMDNTWDVDGWSNVYGSDSFPVNLENGVQIDGSGGGLSMGTSGHPTSTVVPNKVSNTYNWLSNGDETPVDLIISGLDATKKYDFIIYASRDNATASGDRTTTYSVVGTNISGSVNPVGNTSTLVTLPNVSPASTGVVVIQITKLAGNYGYINAMIITEASGTSSSQTPFGGTNWNIPGLIEAEDFDEGGEDVAYHDTDESNNGGAYRTNEGVDIQASGVIGWFKDGEWMEYTVNVEEGTYDIDLGVGTTLDGTQLLIYLDNELVATKIINNTGSWSITTQTITNVELKGGNGKILKLENKNNDFDFDWIDFRKIGGGQVNVTTYDTLQSVATDEAMSKNPDDVDENPADLMIRTTSGDTETYEGFVKFDISSISTENLVSAAVVTYGGQHNPDGQSEIDPYWIDMYGSNTTDWPSPFTWNNTRNMHKSGLLASDNIQAFAPGYTFDGALVAEWIKMKKAEGATEVVFRFNARDEHPWDIWLSGTWKGEELILEYGKPTTVASTETLQSVATEEARSANPDQVDDNPADIMVMTTADNSENYEGFVKFDISTINVDNLIGAAVVTYGGQHNPSGQTEIDPYLVDMYGCNTTDWPSPFTWNNTRNMHKSHLLASENIQAFAPGYTFGGQFVVEWIKAKKAENATEVAFRFNARNEHPWDIWLSGTWKGEELVLEFKESEQVVSTETLQSVNTEEAGATNPDNVDSNRADIMVHKTENGTNNYEAFVKFDVSNVDADNLLNASVVTWGGQHNPSGENMIAAYWVDMYGCNTTDWPTPFTWNNTRSMHKSDNVLASENIQEQKEGYTFGGKAVSEWIKTKKAEGATEVTFRYEAKEQHPWDIWLSGTWKGQELVLEYGSAVSVSDIIDEPAIGAYPNPVKDVLNLTNLPSRSIISVYNISGRKVMETQNDFNPEVKMQMNNLLPGIYIVKVISSTSKIYSIKVIKR